jgi:hypothetical protein
MVLQTVAEELPSGDIGDMVPVVLPMMDVGMVPNGIDDIAIIGGDIAAEPGTMNVDMVPDTADCAGTVGIVMEGGGRAGTVGSCGAGTVEPKISVVDDIAGCADSVRYGAIPVPVMVAEVADDAAGIVDAAEAAGIAPIALLTTGMDVTGTAGVPGAICAVGVEQVTTVPGIAGSDASGTGASVVSGAPDRVVAENGPGPLRGEVTIAPGVDEIPIAVVPMVET